MTRGRCECIGAAQNESTARGRWRWYGKGRSWFPWLRARNTASGQTVSCGTKSRPCWGRARWCCRARARRPASSDRPGAHRERRARVADADFDAPLLELQKRIDALAAFPGDPAREKESRRLGEDLDRQ